MTLARIQIRRDTTAGWAAANPTLAAGEPAVDTTLKQMKVGDGATPWSGLPWVNPSAETIASILATADTIESATSANDALMTAVAADEASAFATAQRGTIDAAIVAADISSNAVTLAHPDHLRRFRTALGRARFSQVHVVIEGDSVVAGGNSGDEVPTTNAQKLKALMRGWVSQLRALFASWLGIDAGEGWVGISGDEGRWTFTGSAPSPGAYGPVATGARLSAGNDATALDQDFRYLDFVGFTGGAVTHPPRIEIDDVDVRPTAMNADAKNGVVAAGKWAAVGANTTVTQPATRRVRLTAVGTGTVRADFGGATGDFAVTAGDWLLFTVAAIAPAARQGGVSAYFYDNAGTQIGSELSVNVTSGAGSYAQSTGFIQVPTGATKMKPVLRGNTSMTAGEYIELESFDIIRVTRWTPAGGTMYKLPTIDAGTVGPHKIKIFAPLANQVDVAGMWLRKRNDAGVLVSRLAKSGTTTTDHVTNSGGANPTAQQWLSQNEVQNAVAPVALRVVALGKNDFNGGSTSPATYRANLEAIATKAIAAGECVLLMADARYSNNTGKPYAEELFYAEARDIAADTDHVAFIDISESWGTNAQATALGFMESGFGIHPNLAGHGDIARIVIDALTRQVTTAAA